MDRRTTRLLPWLLMLILAGCGSRDSVVGRRPAISLSDVAEAYLQLYQPGPVPRVFQTTFIYDRNGTLLAELIGEGRREWVPLDQISPHLINATIATEDATFFTNPGIDPVRIAGAALQNVEQGEIVSGASTITMQLARNLFLGSEERYDQTFDRKIAEAGLAGELTQTYAKGELLELYLNLLNYGHLAYGPQAAARTYFGKSADELNLAEATLIAGIPQSPARFDLFADLETAKERQRTVLSLMVRHGFLTLDEANIAFGAKVELGGSPEIQSPRAPHFVDYVVGELDKTLGEGFDVRRSGFHIFSTLDLSLQETAEQIVSRQVAALRPRYDMNNGALIALKPGTAEILAMVGSVDYKNEEIDGQVNVSISPRQPGSSIKPILYATAFNDDLISPATVLWDTPITYTISTTEEYEPLNYDRRPHGPVTARAALANSFNVPAVKLLDSVGVERMLESARKMGVNSLHRGTDWYGLSLTLGGGEVTLLDLASAYHTMANGGRYLPPRYVLTITDGQGITRLENTSAVSESVISEAAATLVTDILSDDPARVPMFGAQSPLTLSRPVAAKTGTTDNNRDAWTMGFTRHLLAGVWVGNTDGRPMRNATGAAAAAPVWNEFMRTILADPALLVVLDAPLADAEWEFPINESVQLLDACPPGLTCRRGGGELYSTSWLDSAGSSRGERDQGESEEGQVERSETEVPLVDSVVIIPSAPVYVRRQTEAGLETRILGFCGHDEGAVRTLLALPDPFGLPQDSSTNCNHCWSMGEEVAEAVDEGRLLRDRRSALFWNMGPRHAVYLGQCEEMEVMAAYTGLAIGIDTANAGSLVSPETFTTGQLSDAGNSIALGPHSFYLDRLWHDDQCPGQYVMGLTINERGDALPGVQIRLTDAWANTYQSVSKSGSNDSGRFDFPIYGEDTPQRLTLQVLDAQGNPNSSPILVPHRTDEASNRPCHHLVVRRQS